MEKRSFVAIALSMAVLLAWSFLLPKSQTPVPQSVVTNQTSSLSAPLVSSAPIQAPAAPVQAPELLEESSFEFSTEKLNITFIEPLAAIQEIEFLGKRNHVFPLKAGFWLGDKSLRFQKTEVTSNAVTFVHLDQNKKISKRFIFSNTNYGMDLELNVQSMSNLPLRLNLPLILGVPNFASKSLDTRYLDLAVSTVDKMQHVNARKTLDFNNLKFLALRDQYFCAIVEPEFENNTAYVRKIDNTESEVGINLQEIELKPKQKVDLRFHIYLGPQDLKEISFINKTWGAIINFGTFDIISQILLQVLDLLYKVFHNWGVAIIALSVLVYFLLYPLTLKQMRSMKAMQAVQPKVEEIRRLYKDNPQRLNKEIMALYKEHKVNPLGGCLPMLLQMPIFFALYQALIRSVALRGANFLWIKDLSEPDRLFTLPFSIPILGNEVNILPLIMTLGMFVQQKFSMQTSSSASSSAEQQKIMMIAMPLMFGFIFYKMPSGLVLYWFVNSMLMLVYQIRISRSK
ncbi:MAG: membrane protein insertase YidC [Candidatus Omnitrophica bacterium]|nr:membrane protein insertase YidC [Candidatus Omnitrophota bacterium]